tara:strand:- start:3861 stop:4352 length:492 start_codon:yes stop_codon:yes gene_type:complete
MSVKWMEAIKVFTDNVKKGVLTNDIKLIQDSLEEFMGEKLAGMSVGEIETDEPPQEPTVKKQEVEESFEMPKVERKKEKQRLASKEPIDVESDRDNDFTDDGTLGLDEVGADRIDDSAQPPTKRTRNPAKGQVDATCYVCGKSEKVHPSQYREHYRCSNCCRG